MVDDLTEDQKKGLAELNKLNADSLPQPPSLEGLFGVPTPSTPAFFGGESSEFPQPPPIDETGSFAGGAASADVAQPQAQNTFDLQQAPTSAMGGSPTELLQQILLEMQTMPDRIARALGVDL